MTVYVNGEEAIIRGIERRQEQFHDEHPRAGEWATFVYAHVDFVEHPNEHTTDVPIGAVRIDGGGQALNEHLLERGLVPEWWVKNEPVPDHL
jgi:hypothetical protein